MFINFIEQLKPSLNSIYYTKEKEMVNMSRRSCCNPCCNNCCRRQRCGCNNNCGGFSNGCGGFGGGNCGCGGGSLIWLLLLFGGCF